MKRGLQLRFTLLVLVVITTIVSLGQTSSMPWLAEKVALGAGPLFTAEAGELKEVTEAKPDVTQSIPNNNPKNPRIADAIARAPQVANDYVVAIRSGQLYGFQATFTVASVALDAADPKVVGRGINGIWRNNPSIFNTALTDSSQITALYRGALTDRYLDELAATNPAKFKGKDLNAIKTEMAKLRAMIQETKNTAVKVKKYYKNDPNEPSLEPNWVVENCAEIWAVRDAILQGAKLKNLVMRTVSIKNGKIKPFCRNCTVTFAEMIKAMD